MSVPKFHEFMKPFLVAICDGRSYSIREVRGVLAKQFKLTEEELTLMLPSGTQTVFTNRVQWAGTYLTKAGLVKKPARGIVAITEEGKKVLKDDPKEIDVDYLTRYDSFRDFQNASSSGKKEESKDIETPDYAFEESFEQIMDTLADEILVEVMKLSPVAFEKMIIDLLKQMGYGAFENSGRTTSITADEA